MRKPLQIVWLGKVFPKTGHLIWRLSDETLWAFRAWGIFFQADQKVYAKFPRQDWISYIIKQSLQLWRFPVVWSDNWFSFHFWSRTWVSRFHRKAGLARTQGGFFCGPHAASDAHGQWKPVTQHAAPTAPEASALIRSPRRIFNWKMVSAQRAWYL